MPDVVTNFKQPKPKRKPRNPKDVATELHALAVKYRDGYACVRCKKHNQQAQIQCAHVFSRRFAATRTDLANAAALCAGCHRRLTERPHEHVEFFQWYLGMEAWEALKAKAYNGEGKVMKKAFWDAEVERLRAYLKAGV